MKLLLVATSAAALWTIDPGLAVGFLLVAALIGAVLNPTRRPASRPGPRRWGWAVGVGLTTHGPFPFVTFYRRRRP